MYLEILPEIRDGSLGIPEGEESEFFVFARDILVRGMVFMLRSGYEAWEVLGLLGVQSQGSGPVAMLRVMLARYDSEQIAQALEDAYFGESDISAENV